MSSLSFIWVPPSPAVTLVIFQLLKHAKFFALSGTQPCYSLSGMLFPGSDGLLSGELLLIL